MFIGVGVLRFEVTSTRYLITLLYVLPIALVAVERGLVLGLATAALGLAMFGLWDAATSHASSITALDYITRGAVLLLVGGVTGALADRMRKVVARSDHFWQLSNDLFLTAGFDGLVKRVNPAWERTLGWTPAELLSLPFIELVHPDDRVQTEAEAAALTNAAHETIDFENRYRCKDGSYRTLLWSATGVPEDGVIYAIGRDGTETKRSHDELRSSEQFLDSVLENLPNMVFVKDAEHLRFVRLNRAGEELLGVPRDALIGKSDHDLFAEQQATLFVQKDREVLAGDSVIDIAEEPIDTALRGRRTLHTSKIAIRERGEPRYLLGISEDITDRKLAEQEVETARAEAESANQAKSEFLSRMSHELRTPLNAVIGFGQLLELDELEAQQQEAVAEILKAGRHLLHLINEVLDISRIETRTMTISLEPVHVGSVLADALSLIRPLADQAGIRLSADPSDGADLYVKADQQRLKQVLINLLSNGVKYNRPGGELSVRCTNLRAGRVEIAVVDNGIGMTTAQLEKMFEPFDRLGAERTDVEGTGLGLSLCKGLVEAMEGSITAESEPEVGTTMLVELARAQQQPEVPAHNGTPTKLNGSNGERRTILYIEDNLSNVILVKRVLARLPQVQLIPAMQGKLGIGLARHHRPDLIILDLHLPDLHGREVLAQLKDDPATTNIPVVIMSADANPAQLDRLKDAGAATYLRKPIDVESLLSTVTSLLKRTQRASQTH
jgi:PAS domain S-box-containing protein